MPAYALIQMPCFFQGAVIGELLFVAAAGAINLSPFPQKMMNEPQLIFLPKYKKLIQLQQVKYHKT